MLKKNILFTVILFLGLVACKFDKAIVRDSFQPTEESSKPWVYWYWMQSAYSKAGITADLEAMKDVGIGGAYLMSIKGPTDPPLIDPPIIQLSPEWWDMVKFAMTEADRLGVKLAMHASDGFAVAGGPWITPELSMQKVVWTDTLIQGGTKIQTRLPEPTAYEGYYEDIATFALPVNKEFKTTAELLPVVTSSSDDPDPTYLVDPGVDGNFRLYEKGWIQYSFESPFTCRSIKIETKGNNYQAHRLKLEISDNGEDFREITRLEPPRHGWQDSDADHTHSIEPVTAKYYRLVYDPEGSESGAEDLDAAKWKPSLKVTGIAFSEEPLIGQYEGKSGAVWRISSETTSQEIPDVDCFRKNDMIMISEFVDKEGNLSWEAPSGKWRIMRFGHTSTGHMNATGGGGKGLEVDKFNPEAISLQFDKWYGEAIRTAGPALASRVLKILHIDSWESGSQNWSPVFREEFQKRRGYDIVEFLPVMAGIPIENSTFSEKLLYDVRKTISELITDNFFGTMAAEAKKAGVKFGSENVAPTMPTEALLHYKDVDYPGGEFWLRSPTHDKPNDMLDAISGGHIYGKNIIQAEAFTQLRMDWDEHPGNLKTLGDRQYALGVNHFFYHVFVHNPWTDRKPGMTLDGVGSYFQRDQTWWEPGKAWVDYASRVQFQLQNGDPVIDLAVFTGEEIPSRAVLPDRLLPFLPGVFGEKRVEQEKERLANKGLPVRKMPSEVTSGANITDLSQWIDPLHGYKYDSFNPDVLLDNARVEDGKVIFKSGMEYAALIFPGSRKMSPNKIMSKAVAAKILALVKEGATILVDEKPVRTPGLNSSEEEEELNRITDAIWEGKKDAFKDRDRLISWKLGEGKVIQLPYNKRDFSPIGIHPDVLFADSEGEKTSKIAWTHRKTSEEDIYFLSNQVEEERKIEVSFRVTGKIPELYDPVQDKIISLKQWHVENGRTIIPLKLEKNEALFVIFKEETSKIASNAGRNRPEYVTLDILDENWEINFDAAFHGPSSPISTAKLFDWSSSSNDSVRYYSGTATYKKTFTWKATTNNPVWLNLGEIANIAEVNLNGEACGTAWTYPYRVDITEAIKSGENTLVIKITNTWANRLTGDQKLPEKQRLTKTTAAFRLQDKALLKAGLLGPLSIETEKNNSNNDEEI